LHPNTDAIVIDAVARGDVGRNVRDA
jgi:hypothetical protein